MVNIRVDDRQLRNHILKLNTRLKSGMKKVFNKLANETLKRTDKRWDQQVNPDFEPWKPLAFSTIMRKGHATILYDTGLLQDSIEKEIYNDGYKIFTDVDYAVYHQYGTHNIEKREFLGFEEEEVKRAREIIVNFLEKGDIRE
jgi:phage virion morphogenesis protein